MNLEALAESFRLVADWIQRDSVIAFHPEPTYGKATAELRFFRTHYDMQPVSVTHIGFASGSLSVFRAIFERHA